MVRLTIVAGPNRGASYKFEDGEIGIGRHESNQVVLVSAKISKNHCALRSAGAALSIKDLGSANGTFVNGALVTEKSLKSGDKISVGEFVLEVRMPMSARHSRGPSGGAVTARVAGQSLESFPVASRGHTVGGARLSLVQNPGQELGRLTGGVSDPMITSAVSELAQANSVPKDLKGKGLWYFENYAMPFFYGLNLKYEWKHVCAAVFALFLLLNLAISVQPLLDENRAIILKESARRARFMARQIADKNAPILKAGAETQTDLGSIETAEGVNVAALIDLDQRIIAPAAKMNQYLASGPEARVANDFAQDVRKKDRETGLTRVVDDIVVAVEPVKLFNPGLGKNGVVAMAVVSIDSSSATLGMGEIATIYSHTLILTGLLGGLMLLILYRLSLKPFQILNEDMDKALKGDLQTVTHEFKVEELDPLWDLINSALQRIPRSSHKGMEGGNSGSPEEVSSPEQYVGPLRMIADSLKAGLVILGGDRKITYMNSIFEELSGLHADAAVGQELGAVARDQSLGSMVQDMLDRLTPGGDGVVEDYEFSGVGCSVQAAAFGVATDPAVKAFALLVMRKVD